MVYIIDRSRNNRKHDLEQIRREWQSETDPGIRKNMAEAAQKIVKENRAIRDMRDSLIREHREGNTENIKDIHEIVKKKEKYQNPK